MVRDSFIKWEVQTTVPPTNIHVSVNGARSSVGIINEALGSLNQHITLTKETFKEYKASHNVLSKSFQGVQEEKLNIVDEQDLWIREYLGYLDKLYENLAQNKLTPSETLKEAKKINAQFRAKGLRITEFKLEENKQAITKETTERMQIKEQPSCKQLLRDLNDFINETLMNAESLKTSEHWLTTVFRRGKSSSQILFQQANQANSLFNQVIQGKIDISTAKEQFKQLMRMGNVELHNSVSADAAIADNIAFTLSQVENLAETGLQLALTNMFGSEVGFLGSGSARLLNSFSKLIIQTSQEHNKPANDKEILQIAYNKLINGEEWKQDFQETTQMYLTQKLGQKIPERLGKVASSGALYVGSDLINQVLGNLMERKEPLEKIDTQSLGISFLCGIVGGALSVQLSKSQLCELPKLLIEAGYDGLAGLVQEIILALRDGRPIDIKTLIATFVQEFGGELGNVRADNNHQQSNISSEIKIDNKRTIPSQQRNSVQNRLQDHDISEDKLKNIYALPEKTNRSEGIDFHYSNSTHQVTQVFNEIPEQIISKILGRVQAHLRYPSSDTPEAISSILQETGIISSLDTNKLQLLETWVSSIKITNINQNILLREFKKIVGIDKTIQPDSLASIHEEITLVNNYYKSGNTLDEDIEKAATQGILFLSLKKKATNPNKTKVLKAYIPDKTSLLRNKQLIERPVNKVFIDSTKLLDPDLSVKESVRFYESESQITNQDYVNCLRQSLEKFKNALITKDISDYKTFISVLLDMHRTLIKYKGVSYSKYAGIFRAEVLADRLLPSGKNTHFASEKDAAKIYAEFKKAIIEAGIELSDPDYKRFSTSENIWEIGKSHEEVVLCYAIPQDIPLFLREIQESLIEVLRLSMGEYAGTRTTINRIANIVQDWSMSQPFHTVNNSLVMGLANYLLRINGLNGIEHGAIDFISNFMNETTFEEYFFNKVVESNPQLKAN